MKSIRMSDASLPAPVRKAPLALILLILNENSLRDVFKANIAISNGQDKAAPLFWQDLIQGEGVGSLIKIS